MKIIDLLNKIANGEEVPKKIKFKNNIYKWIERNDNVNNYKQEYKGRLIDNYLCDDWFMDSESILNDEVEIIEEKEICHKCHKYPAEYNQTYCEFCLDISKLEEKKIPEKIKVVKDNSNDIVSIIYDDTKYDITILQAIIIDNINAIIDYLKSKGDE